MEKHGQSQGYKSISRDLNVPVSTVCNIIKRFTVFSAAAGTGVVFLSPRRSEGGSAPGSGADYPSGGGGAWI